MVHLPENGDPLERFVSEHEEALAELQRLETAVEELQAGEPIAEPLATMRDVHGFLASSVRQHNENEERALFPLLAEDAPTELFEEEHVELREHEETLLQALESADPDTAVAESLALIELLRAHIERENEVLFPLARAQLGDDGLAEVARRLNA